jgi:hypothetical protein
MKDETEEIGPEWVQFDLIRPSAGFFESGVSPPPHVYAVVQTGLLK